MTSLADRRRRFVHLGDRLLAIGRIRSGLDTIEKVADEYDIEPDEVMGWIDTHAGDRLVTLDELRVRATPEMRTLAQRAQRLALLVAEAERTIRDLHQEYILALAASNEPFDYANNLDDFPNARAERVARRQP
jgi:hypothetical protein